MNLKLNFSTILFLDIETVPEYQYWDEVPEETQQLFETKTAYQRKDEISPEDFYKKAGIWAEFGKIICISVGYFSPVKNGKEFRVRSFYGDDEAEILQSFKALLDQYYYLPKHLLCAHNGKEFDFPYIARRMIIHGIPLPALLNLFGKKPWEIPHIDTMDLWKFGDYKHFSSLKLLTHILGIPSPKDDIDGSDVAKVYYQDQALERIVAYCEKDTLAVAQLLLRFNNEPLLEPSQIVRVT